MKRDMDLIRSILLSIENNDEMDAYSYSPLDPEDIPDVATTASKLNYHLTLLIEQQLLRGKVSMLPIVSGLTMSGHDFLDSIRDPLLWEQTKKAAGEAGGFTLELLGDLARGFIKTQIERHTGVSLG